MTCEKGGFSANAGRKSSYLTGERKLPNIRIEYRVAWIINKRTLKFRKFYENSGKRKGLFCKLVIFIIRRLLATLFSELKERFLEMR